MIYVDALRRVAPTERWRWRQSAHMIADTLGELHTAALAIGLRRQWFQPRSFPHYDLTVARHARALEVGAKLVDRRELVAVIRRVRAANAAVVYPDPLYIGTVTTADNTPDPEAT